MQHLLVTRDFLPDMSGAARRFVSLSRGYPEPMSVSTTGGTDSALYDSREEFAIHRVPFGNRAAATLLGRLRWERWLTARARGRAHVLHAGDISVAGRVVRRSHRRIGIPYIVHVNADELARLRVASATSRSARRTLRLVLGDASGIVAPSDSVAATVRDVMSDAGISTPPPVASCGLGADPGLFSPGSDTGTLRQRWGIRRAPIMLTVGRLSPHKGQDTGIQSIALLRDEFPHLRYVLVGEGADEARLRNLAADLNVIDLVGFAGSMRDDELPEAYATSTIYLDASRSDSGATSEGHGISLIEAQAAGLPIIATGGETARAVVRAGETAWLLGECSAETVADAVATLLRDPERRIAMSLAARESVESRLNWGRVTRDTARFVRECVANG